MGGIIPRTLKNGGTRPPVPPPPPVAEPLDMYAGLRAVESVSESESAVLAGD